MNCVSCGKNTTRAFLVEIFSGGNIISGYHCVKCIKRNPELKLMFKEFAENKNTGRKKKVCSFCGMTPGELKASGFAGCAMCYRIFRPYFRKEIRKIHTGLFHRGKAPAGNRNVEIFLRRFEIRMKQAVMKFDLKKIEEIKRKFDFFIENGR
ncbi:MAG: hypothetical protein NC907_05700 [Candidatus Omnitrophica bacterium]|nr:hypothetical protein [Candidatus Omnitrophota bacterium]MCM8789265.1 hypothetical protein [Candidatus Omnitrophota bacterium]